MKNYSLRTFGKTIIYSGRPSDTQIKSVGGKTYPTGTLIPDVFDVRQRDWTNGYQSFKNEWFFDLGEQEPGIHYYIKQGDVNVIKPKVESHPHVSEGQVISVRPAKGFHPVMDHTHIHKHNNKHIENHFRHVDGFNNAEGTGAHTSVSMEKMQAAMKAMVHNISIASAVGAGIGAAIAYKKKAGVGGYFAWIIGLGAAATIGMALLHKHPAEVQKALDKPVDAKVSDKAAEQKTGSPENNTK